ncbi:MAG: COG4223 family protein [Parvularculaceae bacterium]
MSEKDDAPKPETPPESKNDSNDGKTGPDGDARPAPEEVEAEIVEEEDAPAPADIETAPADTDADTAGDADSAPGAAPAAKFAAGLSPGVVIFLLFAVAVAGVFTVWRFQKPAPDSEPTAAEASGDSPDIAAQGEAAEAANGAVEKVAPSTEAVSSDKISNDAAAKAKEAADAIEPTAEEIASGPGLPPPPSASAKQGNEAIQRAAKEAAQLYGPDAATGAQAQEPEFGQDTDNFSGTDPDAGSKPVNPRAAIEALQREAEKRAAAEDARLYGEPAAETADATPAEALDAIEPAGDTGKIANELAALKEAFQTQTENLNAALEEEHRRSARQSAEIDALREEIGKVRSGSAAPASRRAAAALALISLQRSIDAGGPYKEELEVLQRLAPDLAAVERLRARAEIGAPTVARLKERFPDAARAAIAASDRARADGPFGRLMANLQSLVSARPARPQPGDGVRAVISRAEARLAADDLAGALGELDALEPVAEEAMGPWLIDARARDVATQAIDDLNGLLLNALQD